EDHPDCALTQLGGIFAGSCHRVHPLSKWTLRETRCDSVTDPTGAVLQAAQIALRNTGTGENRTAVTDQDGAYRFSLLSPGNYELTVEAVGFAGLVVKGGRLRFTEVGSLVTEW